MADAPDTRERVTAVLERIAADTAAARHTAACLPRALALGDTEGAGRCLTLLWERLELVTAFRRVARLPSVPPESQDFMLHLWQNYGDHLRQELGTPLLARVLRVVLPPYRGPDMTLYRGNSARNLRNRTYGLAWSASQEMDEGFARGIWRTFEGGSVLLRAQAPAAAIICCLGDHERPEEEEYLVEARRLGRVELLARFSQQSPREYQQGAVNG
jgi:hypothetical protein